MKTFKFALGVFLLGMACILGLWLVVWSGVIWRAGDVNAVAFKQLTTEMGWLALLFSALLGGALALLNASGVRSRDQGTKGPKDQGTGKPRKFSWTEIEKILIVGSPGSPLLRLMDEHPEAAREILNRVYDGQSLPDIYYFAAQSLTAALEPPDLLQAAVRELQELYRGAAP